MKSRDFCFWLQGYFELTDRKSLSEEQVQQIKKHLSLVFKHEIDASMGNEEHQSMLNHFHHGSNLNKDELVRC